MPKDQAMQCREPPWRAWFGDDAVESLPLAGGGFSGSGVFLVRHPRRPDCVAKQFGTDVPPGRAAWVHRLMGHLRDAGLATVPAVHAVLDGSWMHADCPTLATDGSGTLWELVAFVPGKPRPHPTDAEVMQAVAGLARLHAVAAEMPGDGPRVEASPGVARRIMQAHQILAEPWHAIAPPPTAAPLRERLDQAVEIFEAAAGRQALRQVASTRPLLPVTTQPVLRDVWCDHVLYAADGRLAGFIDYHAAARDTPATDLARLLGSWDVPSAAATPPWPDRWRTAIDGYAALHPAAGVTGSFVAWLHATGVICGLDNWFRWLITERRTFADTNRVLGRVDRLVAQLPDALAALGNEAAVRD